jgi:hypothetical protein
MFAKGARAQGADPPPPQAQLMQVESFEQVISLLPTGIDDQYSQTISIYVKQRICADVNYPYERKCCANSVVPPVNSLLCSLEAA